jgi:hypothetical protein
MELQPNSGWTAGFLVKNCRAFSQPDQGHSQREPWNNVRWHKLYRTEVGWLTSRGPWQLKYCFFFFKKGTIEVLLEYLQLDIPDQRQWRLARSGSYSSKSAYVAFFSQGPSNPSTIEELIVLLESYPRLGLYLEHSKKKELCLEQFPTSFLLSNFSLIAICVSN